MTTPRDPYSTEPEAAPQRDAADLLLREHALRIQLQGFTVLPGMLPGEACAEACREFDRILAEEADLPGVPQGPHGAWAYNLMNKATVFEQPYRIGPLLELIRHFLGPDAVLQGVMGRKVMPGAPAQTLHYDGSLTGPYRAGAAADRELRAVSHVFGVNVIFCLNDFTGINGATRVVPGSHRLATREILREGPVPGEVVVQAPAGSALVFNLATWHGQSAHRGSEPRYALITPWRRSWVRPEVDLSRMVCTDVLERAGPEGRTIFGFTARPPYTERWQWDPAEGRPKPEWRNLERDEPASG